MQKRSRPKSIWKVISRYTESRLIMSLVATLGIFVFMYCMEEWLYSNTHIPGLGKKHPVATAPGTDKRKTAYISLRLRRNIIVRRDIVRTADWRIDAPLLHCA
jgi:hypothetical protein